MTKEREILDLISQYVEVKGRIQRGALPNESLDGIAETFAELLACKDEDSSHDNIPPIVTRAEEADASLDGR